MSVLYVWDPTEIKYKEVPYPIVRKNNKYYNSIGYRYTTKTGRYIRIWGSGNYRAAAPAIVPFPSGEWTDICNMLESHYLGFINVSAYWKIGDSRIFHIDEIPATDTMPGQPAQDIELTIVDFNKDELTTPGVFRKKAAVSLIAKNILENRAITHTSEIAIPWTNWVRRNWLANDLFNAFGESVNKRIQSVKKNTYRLNSNGIASTTNDTIWMPSATEMANVYPAEGIFYEYYAKNGAEARIDKSLENTDVETDIYLDLNLIDEYFTISNGSIPLYYDGSWGGWINGNRGRNSSSSGSSFIAKKPFTATIEWSVSSERNYDKIWIDCQGSRVVNGPSGSASGSFVRTFNTGDALSMSYSKDGSVHSGSDTACIKIKTLAASTYYPTRTTWDTGLFNIDGKTGNYVGTSGSRFGQTANSPIKIGFCL